ncbi:MAG TPA: efflux RND transporter periplasmic adaptor subunit [Candidatus Accumulibacter phosphatis]|nr:MAG: Acriflavine resistance protein A precursor [Candidatus Accumulibacter sp. SK-11]HRL75459.1 efflux RND transporter periplasmic adaptor subunit [Candidatus Accumulibacter phosphatis]HRQ94191.1 efflux RND transporter periplasmic adaptor subunit [Candidatus Accumulibacter phosphatis]
MTFPHLPHSCRTLGVAAAAFAGLLLLAGTGCSDQKAAAPAVPVVDVVTALQKDVPIYMEWIGSLEGNVNAVIRPQVTGYLIKQSYREGDLVKQGQPLFEIDPRTFEAAVEEAKGVRAQQAARYETTRANLARIKPLAALNAVSQKDLDDATGADLSAKAALEAADASLKTAKLNLGFTRISSPVTGIAGIAKAQIGDLLSPSMPTELTTVSTVDPIKVYFNISEREYLKVATAAIARGSKNEDVPLELFLVDGSLYPRPGKFYLLNRQVDPTTGTFKAAALFANPDNLLRPGQYGKVRATMSVDKGALLVPQRAVTEIQGKYLLAVVGADNKVDVRPVTVGERIGSDWIISKGLQPGETVVAEGTQKVRTGLTVTPRPFVPEAPAAGTPAAPADKPAPQPADKPAAASKG